VIDDDLRVAAGAEREWRGWLLWWPPWLCARKNNPLVRDALQRFVVVCSRWGAMVVGKQSSMVVDARGEGSRGAAMVDARGGRKR